MDLQMFRTFANTTAVAASVVDLEGRRVPLAASALDRTAFASVNVDNLQALKPFNRISIVFCVCHNSL